VEVYLSIWKYASDGHILVTVKECRELWDYVRFYSKHLDSFD